jgi:hypothetical protein
MGRYSHSSRHLADLGFSQPTNCAITNLKKFEPKIYNEENFEPSRFRIEARNIELTTLPNNYTKWKDINIGHSK